MTTRAIWTPNAGAQQLAWERMDVKQLFFGGGRGCVHPDTLLDTPNGKIKIKDFKGGDVYSFKDGKIITTYATPPRKGTKELLCEVKLHTGQSVICTDQHKFYAVDLRATTGPEWVQLQDLTLSHLIMVMSKGDAVSVNTIKSISAPNIEEFYYDIHVPETNCYFAQGILHHNSGKTSWIIGVALTQWAMYGASARCLILRRQFRDLREIIRQAKEILCDNGLATYNASEHVFYGKGRFKGATLELGNLERIDDYSRYHGNAYSMVGFDEITEFGSWDMVDRMGSTCRSKDPRVNPIMRFTGNPGGRLHQEVKRRFYDPAPMGNRLLKTKDKKLPDGTLVKGQTRMMVSSTVKDNPFLWENDPDYVSWLLGLPETLRKAWFEGCWDIAIGSFFGDVWNARDHVIRPIEPKDVPADWEIRRAFDWGSSTPFCLVWYTISNGDPLRDGRQFPRGAIIILWEFYGSNPTQGLNVGLFMSNIQQAQAIARKEMEMGIHQRVMAGPADNQIYANTNGTDSNLYINFEREGILFTKSNKSSSATSLEQVRTRMAGRDGRPLIYFTESCSNCIRTIPEIARHPTKLNDIDDNQEDHCFVAGTMITMADGSHKAIETVKIGDIVATRTGFHKVEASYMTRTNAQVVEVTMSDGRSIVGTDNHPIFVSGHGYKEIRLLASGCDKICSLIKEETEWQHQKGSFLTASPIGDTQSQRDTQTGSITSPVAETSPSEESQICTETLGYSITETFLKGTKFIIRTWTTITTKLKTLIASKGNSIENSTQITIVGNVATRLGNTWQRSELRPANGIDQTREGLGIVNTLRIGRLASLLITLASGVKKSLSQKTKIAVSAIRIACRHGEGLTAGTIFKWSAHIAKRRLLRTNIPECRHAHQLVLVKSVSLKGKADVYNLTVSGDHSYFANGILVHNCTDVIKYIAIHHPINLHQKGVGSDELNKIAQKRLKA